MLVINTQNIHFCGEYNGVPHVLVFVAEIQVIASFQ